MKNFIVNWLNKSNYLRALSKGDSHASEAEYSSLYRKLESPRSDTWTILVPAKENKKLRHRKRDGEVEADGQREKSMSLLVEHRERERLDEEDEE